MAPKILMVLVSAAHHAPKRLQRTVSKVGLGTLSSGFRLALIRTRNILLIIQMGLAIDQRVQISYA